MAAPPVAAVVVAAVVAGKSCPTKLVPTTSPAEFTFAFLEKILPDHASHIIEVGCGDGSLAKLLQDAEYKITAIDHDQELVNTARSRGVNALCADWLSWQPEPADMVLFTRSLHHLDDVNLALEKAADCLGNAGMIVAEDFAFSDTSLATAQWFKDWSESLFKQLQQPPAPDSFVQLVLEAANPLTAWRNDHHHIHPAALMEAGFRAIDPEFKTHSCPYLFRYLVSAFELSKGHICTRLLQEEQRAIDQQGILAIGRRFIATL